MIEAPRNKTSDGGLDLGGVGGEPRYHLAGLGRVEEGGRERREMAEDLAAQIGHDALAQGGDEIKPQRAGKREHGNDPDHHREVAVDQVRAFAGEPEIDHAPDRDRHRQCGERRHDESAHGRHGPPAIAPDIGPQ
jgi:hypothetical protein